MVIRMRHTRAHSKNRRSHHALEETRLSICSSCQEKHQRHRVCLNCGNYRGKIVIDTKSKLEKKIKREKTKKEKIGKK